MAPAACGPRPIPAGGYAGYGSPAFGQRSDDGGLVANPGEQAVIARIRELHAAGLGYLAIAQALNAEGVRSKRGGQWHAQTVKRVLGREA